MVINDTGTGKTRLLFEGLSTRWGLYLPCSLDAMGYGSSDLHYGLYTRLSPPQPFQALSINYAERHAGGNVEGARRVFAQILLARLLLLELFLRHVPDVTDVRQRMRWLLFQLFPSAYVCNDIFQVFARSICKHSASSTYLKDRITDTLRKINSLLGTAEPLFCVVDDVQRASSLQTEELRDRSVLREMAQTWEEHEGLTLVLAGQSFHRSPFSRPDVPPYRLWTDTGSFLDPEEHRAYVRRYLPPDLLSTESGEKLLR
ncbi:hypothetical protein HDZ31DRAFT_79031, partial [Schizophyllum fasciatum]